MKYSELPKEIKLQDDVNTLLDVNEELRKIIDEAIELLERNDIDVIKFVDGHWVEHIKEKLISILRGEDNA